VVGGSWKANFNFNFKWHWQQFENEIQFKAKLVSRLIELNFPPFLLHL